MPTIQYSKNPNVETAFVEQDDGSKNRVVLTAPQDISTIEYPNNPNSTKAYVTVNGKKQRVVMTADISGGGGGGDQHNLGWYATESALTTAHPTADDGDYAIVGSTDTVWTWDSDTSAWVDTDQKGQVTSVNGQTGAVTVSEVPTQTGNAGKFLTTDGTNASWAAVDSLPDQTGQSGKFLTTNGTNASWTGISALQNTATGTDSLTILGTASTFGKSINIGTDSVSNARCIAIGNDSGGAGGATDFIAIGAGAKINASRAIQIGGNASFPAMSTNSTYGTVKIYNGNDNYEIMSADGTVPTARLTKVNTTVTLTSAGWSSNTQTVNVTGMTATGVVFVSPNPTDQADYVAAGIICTSQATDSLTFTCSTTPTSDIDVVVVML